MFEISRANLKSSGATVQGNTIHAEASCIGLRPGEWPDFITVDDERGDGGILLLKESSCKYETRYSTKDGRLRLVIEND